jgi:hypothetical protein
MTRPRPNGPRSLIRTMMDWPVSIAVTCADVPNGRLRCAATRSFVEVRSLDAPRYQDAMPTWLHARGAGLRGGDAEACCGGSGWAQQATVRTNMAHIEARMVRKTPRFGCRTIARLWHVTVYPQSQVPLPPGVNFRPIPELRGASLEVGECYGTINRLVVAGVVLPATGQQSARSQAHV